MITVCFNSQDTIRQTIKSVKEQAYHDIEYIIIDGGSHDRTLDIVREYPDVVSKYISERDRGIYDAMNKGVSAASGDIVGILNSDDFFATPNSINEIVEAFGADPGIEAVYGDVMYVKPLAPEVVTRLYSGLIFRPSLIRFGLMLPHPTFYVKAPALKQLGPYRINYRVAADFELITRFFIRGYRANYIRSVLVKMREGGISSRGLLWRIHQNFEIVQACRENGLYTNIIFVALKLPYKLWTLVRGQLGMVKSNLS